MPSDNDITPNLSSNAGVQMGKKRSVISSKRPAPRMSTLQSNRGIRTASLASGPNSASSGRATNISGR